MRIDIIGKPEFLFKLKPSIVDELIERAELHYDGTVRFMANEKGLLRKWQNNHNFTDIIFKEDDGSMEFAASFRELDLILKVCEIWAFGDKRSDELQVFVEAVKCALLLANMQEWKTHCEVEPK